MIASPSDYRRATKDTATSDSDVTAYLADAQAELETFCLRHFEQAVWTETLLLSPTGYVYPSNTPIVPGSSSIGYTDGNGIALGFGYGVTWPININWLTPWPIPRTDVTYTGGYLPEDMPVAVKRLVCKLAYNAATAQPIPAGVGGFTSISYGDLSLGGGTDGSNGFATWDDATLKEARRWRHVTFEPMNQPNGQMTSWPFV